MTRQRDVCVITKDRIRQQKTLFCNVRCPLGLNDYNPLEIIGTI